MILADAAPVVGAPDAVNDRADIRAAGATCCIWVNATKLRERRTTGSWHRIPSSAGPPTTLTRLLRPPPATPTASCRTMLGRHRPLSRAAPVWVVIGQELGGDDKPWSAIGGINAQRLPAVLDGALAGSCRCGAITFG